MASVIRVYEGAVRLSTNTDDFFALKLESFVFGEAASDDFSKALPPRVANFCNNPIDRRTTTGRTVIVQTIALPLPNIERCAIWVTERVNVIISQS